jgi:hypothetical protein
LCAIGTFLHGPIGNTARAALKSYTVDNSTCSKRVVAADCSGTRSVSEPVSHKLQYNMVMGFRKRARPGPRTCPRPAKRGCRGEWGGRGGRAPAGKMGPAGEPALAGERAAGPPVGLGRRNGPAQKTGPGPQNRPRRKNRAGPENGPRPTKPGPAQKPGPGAKNRAPARKTGPGRRNGPAQETGPGAETGPAQKPGPGANNRAPAHKPTRRKNRARARGGRTRGPAGGAVRRWHGVHRGRAKCCSSRHHRGIDLG